MRNAEDDELQNLNKDLDNGSDQEIKEDIIQEDSDGRDEDAELSNE